MASDYADSINKIVAVGVNLLCPTHQNIALFCNLVGAMLWNGYKEKHEPRFLLQGFDNAISTALHLEEHTTWFSKVDKFTHMNGVEKDFMCPLLLASPDSVHHLQRTCFKCIFSPHFFQVECHLVIVSFKYHFPTGFCPPSRFRHLICMIKTQKSEMQSEPTTDPSGSSQIFGNSFVIQRNIRRLKYQSH